MVHIMTLRCLLHSPVSEISPMVSAPVMKEEIENLPLNSRGLMNLGGAGGLVGMRDRQRGKGNGTPS